MGGEHLGETLPTFFFIKDYSAVSMKWYWPVMSLNSTRYLPGFTGMLSPPFVA